MDSRKTLHYFLPIIILLVACGKGDEAFTDVVVYDDTPYQLDYGILPTPHLPDDNPLTIQGVALGRMLFYDPLLSKDGKQSCATCHRQEDGFSDFHRFSLGVNGDVGTRQAMPVFNLAWHKNGFFWDGRASTVREQALLPIQNPIEMDEKLPNVVSKLQQTTAYSNQFFRAFGSKEVTPEKIGLALEQFMLSIVSYRSKYDLYLAGEATLTESEQRGLQLFETEYNPFFPEQSGADCAHCHGGYNFENDQFMNNGLDEEAAIQDEGRWLVTGDDLDKGKFKVPSLRNVAVTAPYMHDGRFQTLEQVVEHYNSGIKESSTVDPTVLNTMETGLMLTAEDKQDLINFLHTLTDEYFLSNPEYQKPL